MEQISIAIPYHGKRMQWTMQTIQNCHNRQNVSEIVICAEPGSDVGELSSKCSKYKKFRVAHNATNLGPFLNKARVVTLCNSDWVALIDSDNVIAAHYLRFTAGSLNSNKIYCPEQGWPALKYIEFIGEDIGLARAAQLIDKSNFTMLFNTGNYVFHRDTWLRAIPPIRGDVFNPCAVDVAWANYHCLKAGMVMTVVKDCVYRHNVHKESTYLKTAKESAQKWEEIKNMVKESVYGSVGSSGEIQAKKQAGLSSASTGAWAGSGDSEQADRTERPDQNGFDLLSN